MAVGYWWRNSTWNRGVSSSRRWTVVLGEEFAGVEVKDREFFQESRIAMLDSLRSWIFTNSVCIGTRKELLRVHRDKDHAFLDPVCLLESHTIRLDDWDSRRCEAPLRPLDNEFLNAESCFILMTQDYVALITLCAVYTLIVSQYVVLEMICACCMHPAIATHNLHSQWTRNHLATVPIAESFIPWRELVSIHFATFGTTSIDFGLSGILSFSRVRIHDMSRRLFQQ